MVLAHSIPIPVNICRANNGNPAAAIDRRNVLAAMAEAALNHILVRRDRLGTAEFTYNMRYESIR